MLDRVLAALDGAGRRIVVGPERVGLPAGVLTVREEPPGAGPAAATAAAALALIPHSTSTGTGHVGQGGGAGIGHVGTGHVGTGHVRNRPRRRPHRLGRPIGR